VTSLQRVSQIFLLLLSALGTFAGLRLSLEHLQHGEVCPTLGPIPACIIVFLGYLSVLIAAVGFKKNWAVKFFYLGWTPVFLLALSGVVLELTRGHICPPGGLGIPQCFYSFAMAVIAWILFRVLRKSSYQKVNGQ